MKKVFAVAVYKTIAGQVYVLADDEDEALRIAGEETERLGYGFEDDAIDCPRYEIGSTAWPNEYVDPTDCLNYEEADDDNKEEVL